MKNTFLEFNTLDTEIVKKLWDSAIFVFDTNVLLNLYRYSENTSNEFFESIKKLEERVWLPYQVGYEFNKNRLTVISDQKKNYDDFEKKINELIGEIENKNRNPFFSDVLFRKLIDIKNEIQVEIDQKKTAYDNSLSADMLLDKINLAFENKVGSCFKSDEIKLVYNEGEKRYKDKIPPGYCDIKKPENEKYGDLIIWKQIIAKSKEGKNDIIFILDDRKEDWWLEHHGKTISPRPELLREFRFETERNCHFYKPFQFLEYSNEYLGNSIKLDVIEEVKNFNPEVTKNDKFIQISLTLEGDIEDFNLLINEMKSAGYNVYIEQSIEKYHMLYVMLPNIPDLERRLNSKYLSNLNSYHMNLISVTKR
jgi:predicted nucleic acid-binding protein